MQNPDISADAGFTLIEVIVSFVILASILGSTALSLSYSAKLNRQAESKRDGMICAEWFLAERFSSKPGLPSAENGADGEDCRWHVVRKIAKTSYTQSGRNLVALHLDVLDRQNVPIDAFDTYYVEDAP